MGTQERTPEQHAVFLRTTQLIGIKLRTLRKRHSFTQTSLARCAGLHKSNICRAERGGHMPTLPFLRAYADGLGVDAHTVAVAVLEIVEAGFRQEQALGPKPDWK